MADDLIFAELKRDHDRHRDLLERIVSSDPDSEERAVLFEQLRVELQAHAAAEEESLYATMLANPDLRDEARHSVAEHKEIDDYLGQLVEADPSSDAWAKIFKELRHRYLHHIEEEEEEMFPAAARDLDEETKVRLAAVFEKRKPKELERAEDELPGDARE
ncbi:hemerythrin domain-containing protein [Sphingomonas sp.]|uniref:hemerythrin domain-containing protein n=1 Tax=Sphingomonas sp. TaxID=28214 RepID=UPI002EDA16AE